MIIKATNFELTKALEDFVEEKIGGLEKFITGKPAEIFVELGKSTRHHISGPFWRAECQISLPGKKSLRAESEQKNLKMAIVEVKNELHSQLNGYKEKTFSKTKRLSRVFKKELKLSPAARFYRKGRIREEGI